MPKEATRARKDEHIDRALHGGAADPVVPAGFDEVRFVHEALPEMRLADADPSTVLFGRRLAAPILVSCMTGGTERGRELNRRLAAAAERLGLAMGLGSQRAMLDDPSAARTYEVRDIAPDVLLFANLGAVQLNYGVSPEDCRRVVEAVGADVLALHVNPLQEAIQPEGQTNFSGLAGKIAAVKRALGAKPLVVKEVGCGISAETARALVAAGVDGIDVAGAGGTNFQRIESDRAADPGRRALGGTFAAWGIPTLASLVEVRRAAPGSVVIASGGIRNGLDAAKAIALGADAVGIARPLLKAAEESVDSVVALARRFVEELALAMFLTGSRTLADLSRARLTLCGTRPGDGGAIPGGGSRGA